jgi:hypothetical protein
MPAFLIVFEDAVGPRIAMWCRTALIVATVFLCGFSDLSAAVTSDVQGMQRAEKTH